MSLNVFIFIVYYCELFEHLLQIVILELQKSTVVWNEIVELLTNAMEK